MLPCWYRTAREAVHSSKVSMRASSIVLARNWFFLGVCASLLLSSCSLLARADNILILETPDDEEIIFPRRNLPPSNFVAGDALALLRGTLSIDETCIAIIEEDSGTALIPIWPPNFSAKLRDSNNIDVIDSNGSFVARVGDKLVVGGGEASSLEGFDPVFSLPAQEIVHRRCPGDYWIVGEVVERVSD